MARKGRTVDLSFPLCFWQAQVRPKCGRLVAFSSGEDNPHGVWAVTRGRRCAIALWYTLSQEHAEQVTKQRRGRRGGNGPKSIGKIKRRAANKATLRKCKNRITG